MSLNLSGTLVPRITKRFASVARAGYGFAAILFGATPFMWHDYDKWAAAAVLGKTTWAHAVLIVVALMSLFGGLAILWNRTRSWAAGVLAMVYLFFALMGLPQVFATPLIYNAWGNIFEQLSQLCGALLIFVVAYSTRDATWQRKGQRIGIVFFGICLVSFALEQAFYLRATASLVPKWIPPGQMFWAVFTTLAFFLAAIAILSGRRAILAAQLTAVMVLLFVVIIWIPTIAADPQSHLNWTEGAESLAIAATAWLVADALSISRWEYQTQTRS